MIVWHVKAIKHNNKMVDVTPAAKQHRRSTACVNPTHNSNVHLPAPESGSGYSKMEVVNIMLELPVEDGCLRAATVKAIAEHQKKHNVLCCAKTIYCLLKRHANGNAISGQFTGKGRPPTISDADVIRIAQSLEEEVGKTYTGSDVEWMIKKMQAENVESAGFKPIIENSISRWLKLSVSLTNIRFVSITKGCPRISRLKVKGRRWQITSIRRKSLNMVSLLIGCVSSWKSMVCFLMLRLALSRKSEYGIMMLLVD